MRFMMLMIPKGYVYVEDVDAQFAQAVNAGAKAVKPVLDQLYW